MAAKKKSKATGKQSISFGDSQSRIPLAPIANEIELRSIVGASLMKNPIAFKYDITDFGVFAKCSEKTKRLHDSIIKEMEESQELADAIGDGSVDRLCYELAKELNEPFTDIANKWSPDRVYELARMVVKARSEARLSVQEVGYAREVSDDLDEAESHAVTTIPPRKLVRRLLVECKSTAPGGKQIHKLLCGLTGQPGWDVTLGKHELFAGSITVEVLGESHVIRKSMTYKAMARAFGKSADGQPDKPFPRAFEWTIDRDLIADLISEATEYLESNQEIDDNTNKTDWAKVDREMPKLDDRTAQWIYARKKSLEKYGLTTKVFNDMRRRDRGGECPDESSELHGLLGYASNGWFWRQRVKGKQPTCILVSPNEPPTG